MKISSKITSILLIAALVAGGSVFAASAIDEENSTESNSNNEVVAYAESVEASVDTSPEIMVEEVATNPVATGTVQISRNKLTLGVGEGFKLSATVTNTNVPSQALSWSSSNKAVLTVTGNGNVKAVKEGTAVVTVKLKNGSSASCTVTVKKAPTSISLNKKSITLGVGEVFDLNSSLPSGCGAYSIKYYSNNSSVAPVKAAGGLVTAKRAGTAVITAKTYNGKTVSCNVTVKNAPNKISLNKTSLTLGVGEKYDLNSSLPKGTAAYKVLYSTNNAGVADVKAAGGLVTAKRAGTAVVTATTYNGKKVSCKITVKNAPNKISLNKTSLSLNKQGTFDLNSSLPSGTASHSVVYSSSNPKVAEVKSAGGFVTAKSAGTAVITAKTYNGKTAKCTVKVSNASYTQDDLYCLAAVIWQEAGASYCSDRLQLLVANVVMNHVESPYFPNTIRGVITRKGAYGRMYWDGVSIPKANDPITKAAIDRCYANAKKILEGYRILPSSVIYQAGFVQGSGVYTYEEGMYFCYK